MSVAVAYQDTDAGRAALVLAVRQALLERTTLEVLHVIDDDPDGDDRAARERAVEHVAAVLDGFPTKPEWHVHVVAAGGDVAQGLLDLVAESGSTLLVIGSRRRSPVGKLLMGSVVQRVVLDSPVPVLTVKPTT